MYLTNKLQSFSASGGLSVGARAGIAVGVIVGAALAAAIVVAVVIIVRCTSGRGIYLHISCLLSGVQVDT